VTRRNYLCQITAPHFCAGLVVRRGARDMTVIQAAPILRYMIAWSASRVRPYCERKGWDLEIIEIFDDPQEHSQNP